jgi:hypothetical protein
MELNPDQWCNDVNTLRDKLISITPEYTKLIQQYESIRDEAAAQSDIKKEEVDTCYQSLLDAQNAHCSVQAGGGLAFYRKNRKSHNTRRRNTHRRNSRKNRKNSRR